MREIPLTQGKVAIVDDGDYEELSRFNWHCTDQNYAASRIKGRIVRMHRYLLRPPRHLNVDHIDGDGLNNTRSNLRIVTQSQNCMNMRIPRHNTSGYKGVSWDKSRSLWSAKLMFEQKTINLGRFKTAELAAEAYNKKARELFGEYAKLNDIEEAVS